MKNKVQIHQFDPVIYPFKLWVVISNNIECLGERFKKYPSEKKYKTSVSEKLVAFVDSVIEIDTRKIGFLVVFQSKKECSVGCISHEATHVSDRVWNYIGERAPGKEANAYLVEWIAECIEKVKLGKE
ncbi:MAG: hypothetical protein ABFD50_23690 [Smithella sp.]